ncbi:MAG TPA: vitamin K epoxide reductase family protein [Marinagarivorans sp.]
MSSDREIVLVTGATGNIGSALIESLKANYRIVGFDRGDDADVQCDIASEASVKKAIQQVKDTYGNRLAGVVHLAAYFDFSGEQSPLYHSVNVQGTKNLLLGLQDFEVGQFIYASTMLVHRPGVPGDLMTEETPIEPSWAYPQSKAEAEKVIFEHHKHVPVTILRLGGVYDEQSAVPTLTHQIARIYERDPKSILHSGDDQAGQSLIHRDDLISLFACVIDKRHELSRENVFLAGEPGVMSYSELQHRLGRLIHGDSDWKTLSLPKPIAKMGAWLNEAAEPVIPDDFDEGEKPFIRPFMIDMASDHYELNIDHVKNTLGWQPQHRIQTELPKMIDNLKADPEQWYERNGIHSPAWMKAAADKHRNPEKLREHYVKKYRADHAKNSWAPFMMMGLGGWLITSPITMGYESAALIYSDIASGIAVMMLALLSLSSRPLMQSARWALGVVGLWLMTAPLLFWAPTAAAYLNGTLVGCLVLGLAMVVRPFPYLMSPVAAELGPSIPPGWQFSPSDWFQRVPIIALAFIGFFISRYLTAYQLGHIDAVWDPFFAGTSGGDKNGTEDIITSKVSEAWPVPDAGIGAMTYLLEILTGLMGSRRRWRTMPWLVLLFGFMIVPLGAISITFIIIQPIVLGTWCTLCLIAAAAMLLQIPYSFDEIIATIEFLRRRARAGKPWLLILFTGDTDEDSEADKKDKSDIDNFAQSPGKVIGESVLGGVSMPWPLALCALTGIWLMCTRLTLGSEGNMANADHLIGALVLTLTITASAEVMRPIRFLNIFLGMALLITPFIFPASIVAIAASLVCGALLIGCSIPRGHIKNTYGLWGRYVV